MLHNYQGPFPVRGLVDLGPYCGAVEYVRTVEPEGESSGLIFVRDDDVEDGRRRGRRPIPPE